MLYLISLVRKSSIVFLFTCRFTRLNSTHLPGVQGREGEHGALSRRACELEWWGGRGVVTRRVEEGGMGSVGYLPAWALESEGGRGALARRAGEGVRVWGTYAPSGREGGSCPPGG